MVPNRLSFAVVAVACVGAAGVGSYLPTRQNGLSVAVPAASAGPSVVLPATPLPEANEANEADEVDGASGPNGYEFRSSGPVSLLFSTAGAVRGAALRAAEAEPVAKVVPG